MELDWATLALETINVVVLIWLLQRFLWKPVSAMIAARRDQAAAVLREAEAERAEAERLKAEARAARDGIEAERRAAMAEERRAAEAERARLVAAAEGEAQQAAEAARARLEAEAGSREAAYAAHATDLAADMVARLGAEVDGPALRAATLEGLATRLAALPAAERGDLAATPLVLTTAHPLDDAEADTIRSRVESLLGAPLALEFRTDPTLLAGIDLQAPQLHVGLSWRAALTRMTKEVHDAGTA